MRLWAAFLVLCLAGADVANPAVLKRFNLPGNVIIGGDLTVLGAINRGTQQNQTAAAASAGQIGSANNPYFGNLYVRGTVFEQFGNNWIPPTTNPVPGSSQIYQVAYGNGVFVAVCDVNTIVRSTDGGVTWTVCPNPFTGSSVRAVVYADGVFVAGASTGAISRSLDNGATWGPLVPNPFATAASTLIISFAYGRGVIVAGGQNGQIAYSLDKGATWSGFVTTPFVAAFENVNAIVYTSVSFVAVSANGNISRSLDAGKTWSPYINNPFQIAPLKGFNQVAYGNGVLVAGGTGGNITVSRDDGQSWSAMLTPIGTATPITGISFNLGVFQIGDSGGLTAVSSDGARTWQTTANPFGTAAINWISSGTTATVGGGVSVAVGALGSIAISGWKACFGVNDMVPGEASLGMDHPHYAVLINAASPGATGFFDVDCSAQTPVGAKRVFIRIQATWAVAASGTFMAAYKDSTPTPPASPVAALSQVANLPVTASGYVDLDPTRHIKYQIAGSAPVASSVFVWMFYYTE